MGRISTLTRVWLALVALTAVSVIVAERLGMREVAIVAIFVIAAIKGELILDHFMEARHAERHWPIMYGIWLIVVTLLLVGGHLTTPA